LSANDHDQYLRKTLDEVITTINDAGGDYDLCIEGDTSTKLLYIDASINAFQLGATVAGEIADFRPNSIVFNEDGADLDFRVEGDSAINLFVCDASIDSVYIGTTTPGRIAKFCPTVILFNDDHDDIDFRVEGDTDANLFIADAGLNAVSIGAAAAASTGKLQITSTTVGAIYALSDTANTGFILRNSSALGTGSGGTQLMATTLTPDATGRRLGIIGFGGVSTGTTYQHPIQIRAYSEETWDATHAGAYLAIWTTPLASVTAREVLRVASTGYVGILNAAPATALDVTGQIQASTANSGYLSFGNWACFGSALAAANVPYAASLERSGASVTWGQTYRVNTTNDGSNYWNIALNTWSGTNLLTITTAADTAGTQYCKTNAAALALVPATHKGLYIYCTKTGSPGTLDIMAPQVYVK
jgi:hypothetical protein